MEEKTPSPVAFLTRLVCFYLWILKKATWWLGLPSLYNRPFRQATPEFVAAQDMMPALLRCLGCGSEMLWNCRRSIEMKTNGFKQ